MNLYGIKKQQSLESEHVIQWLFGVRHLLGIISTGVFCVVVSLYEHWAAASFLLITSATSFLFYIGKRRFRTEKTSEFWDERIPTYLAVVFAICEVLLMATAGNIPFLFLMSYPTALAIFSATYNHLGKYLILLMGTATLFFLYYYGQSPYIIFTFSITYGALFLYAYILMSRISSDNAIIERLALQDALTGLGNRRALNLCLESKQDSAFVKSMAFIDIDYFKKINDVYGHMFGDCVLEATAAVIRDRLGAHDRAYRIGGEEFVILSSQQDCTHLCRAMQDDLMALTFEYPIEVRVSVGVAAHHDEGELASTLHRADQAMYQAKEAGRDQIVLASTRACE